MRIRSRAIKYGLNADKNESQADDRYVKCWNCLFTVHLDRDTKDIRGSQTGDGITISDGDPIVGSGCPLCGTLLYYE